MMKRFLTIVPMMAVMACFWLLRGDVRADDADPWGTLKGRIVWAGKDIPERRPIASIAKSNDKAHCLAKGDVLDDDWVVNKKNKGLRWSFVWLADAKDPKKNLPIHPDLKEIKKKEVVMDQPNCMFVPHALGMREGQTLLVKNSAPIPHNFKYSGNQSKGIGGNPLMPPDSVYPIKDLPADRLPILINCNIHPWMRGWVRVFNHPYFAVTDENGGFEMPKAPAGQYRLVVWHGNQVGGGWRGGAAGKNGQLITIKAGRVTDLGELGYKAN